MDDELRHRFVDAPGLLAGRRQRRVLRSMVWPVVIALSVGVGVIHSRHESAGIILMTIGRTFAGLITAGFIGLVAGVILTLLTIIIYNGLLNGRISLIDLDYIDEIPLLFAVGLGAWGIFWALKWPDVFGLIGWGLLALVVNAFLFRPVESG